MRKDDVGLRRKEKEDGGTEGSCFSGEGVPTMTPINQH